MLMKKSLTVFVLINVNEAHLEIHSIHHFPQFFTPEVLVVGAVRRLLQVLHVVSQHKVAQGQEVAVSLGARLAFN